MSVWFEAAVALYLGAAVGYSADLALGRERLSRIAQGCLAAGVASQIVWSILRGLATAHIPLTNLFEALAFVAGTLVVAYLAVTLIVRARILGAVVAPVAAILMVIARTGTDGAASIDPLLQSPWFSVHTTLVLLGGAMFSLAFCAGLLYLVQERQIRHKRVGFLAHRLPALQLLDDLNVASLFIGFPLLTLGLIAGALWAEGAWGQWWSWDPKQTWTLVTWGLYALGVNARLVAGWRGRRAAIFSLVGFGAMLFTFLGVNYLVPGYHVFN